LEARGISVASHPIIGAVPVSILVHAVMAIPRGVRPVVRAIILRIVTVSNIRAVSGIAIALRLVAVMAIPRMMMSAIAIATIAISTSTPAVVTGRSF
jgi:hypothetical protein